MKKSRVTFLAAEVLLAVLTVFFVKNIFSGEEPQKRVAVIIENSGDERWDPFINGMKQAADLENIHLIICNTDEIENEKEERSLIEEQLDNHIDAFIIQAAPGGGVSKMLDEISGERPVILVANDVLIPEMEDDIHAVSGFPKIMPDHYEMGYQLGREMLRKNENDIKGKTLGIISGVIETDSARKRQQGLLDALDGSGCEIVWQIDKTHERNSAAMPEKQKTAELIAVLEAEALEELGELAANGKFQGVQLYGIGSTGKSIYYLGYGIIQSLIIADEYYMGYCSVVETSHILKDNFYKMQNHTIDFRILQKEDIFTEENQKFLYSYR